MSKSPQSVLSVVVPVYNEAAGIRQFHTALVAVLKRVSLEYEVLYVDDGSSDAGAQYIADFCREDSQTHLIKFTRNFGKEMATTAGIHAAQGDAVLLLDADGQHPVDAIPRFVTKWQEGARVVVGRRTGRQAPLIKRMGSKLFYTLLHRMAGIALDPSASDFRLIDKSVQADFNRIREHNRITRGLVDWLGYEREYVTYQEKERTDGVAGYSLRKLLKLAVDSMVSLSISPLYVTAYIGAVVLPAATLLGLAMAINFLLHDPLHMHATGGAYLGVLILFLVGILLVSQGIIGLYLSHIHTETQNRPLYVIDNENVADRS
ncbi:MAG TPA: glycosyltransferase family 2 protein [Candidatus Saccharimonadia bacterium]|nr:glycosyltransferase family 2 protein [Candidatus Saccharimonadia bacterium]